MRTIQIVGIACAVVGGQSLTAAAEVNFSGPVAYDAGDWPFDIAGCDLDNDGDVDLAYTLRGESTVRTMFNQGDGSFVMGQSYSAGSQPTGMTCGDFNGDGLPDMANANFGSSSVTVFLSTGGGDFMPAVSYAVGSLPDGVYCADLEADGDLDLVVCNATSNGISILWNNGAGGFPNRTDIATGVQPYRLAIEDLDADGDLDLAVMNFINGIVTIHSNDGSGGFALTASYSLGHQSFHLSSTDLDLDGDSDLVLDAAVMINDGSGAFAIEGSAQHAVEAIGDLNLDGLPDLITGPNEPRMYYHVNEGDWSFDMSGTFETSDRARGVVAADLDGDGDDDLAAAIGPHLGGSGGNISILINEGTPCLADIHDDGVVDTTDLLVLLALWGTNDTDADINGDGVVNTTDMLALLGAWGPCA